MLGEREAAALSGGAGQQRWVGQGTGRERRGKGEGLQRGTRDPANVREKGNGEGM